MGLYVTLWTMLITGGPKTETENLLLLLLDVWDHKSENQEEIELGNEARMKKGQIFNQPPALKSDICFVRQSSNIFSSDRNVKPCLSFC